MSYAGLGQTGTPDIAQWREDVALAHQAGIPVLALKAIQSNESHGHANATRFEPRIFNMVTNNRYQSQFPSDAGSSGTGTAMPAAFNRAYALDPTSAVKATSWGTYQVLIRDAGPEIWAAAGRDPARFIQMFNADPTGISKRILVSWFNGRPPAQAAARAMNLVELAHRYNGCCIPPSCSATGRSCDTYAGRLRTAVDLWTPEWEQVRNLPEIAEAAAAATLRTAVANPFSTFLIGTAILGGGAAFAWWAYSQRKRVKRNRRSSRRVRRNGSRSAVRVEPRPDMQSKAYWVMSDGVTIGVVGELKELGGWWAAPMVGHNRGYITRMNQKDAVDTVADEFEMWGRHGGVRKNRRSSRVRRNKIVIPVTLVAVAGGRERPLGIARGRAEFVKLVKQATPTLAPDERLRVRGGHRGLREVGIGALGSLMILTKDRWVEVTAA